MAIKYLEGGYSENYDEEILDRISIILYVNLERPKDAIAQLETHSRMFGCSKLICARLLSFYSNQNDVDGMLSVYKRMYEKFQNEEFLEKIIQLYVYKKDFMGLRVFLQKNNVENEMLLQLYLNSGEYEKAYKLAYKLYEKTQNIDFLGKGAMYEYESYKKPTKSQLLAIVKKLKKVVKEKPDGLYLNYLGYLLIDHDLDVKEGMKYIKQALAYTPDSAFYLDSLAWGYYKLHECKKADKLFKKIVTLKGGDDPEVVKHQKAVQQCLKKSKGKK
jgi:tetratricopeptide (TPR) repeat protein